MPLALGISFIARMAWGSAVPFDALFWGICVCVLAANVAAARVYAGRRALQALVAASCLAGAVLAV